MPTPIVTALSPVFGAGQQFFTDDGVPLAGGYLYTYAAGTTTPRATYPGNPGYAETANPVPMVLDSAGRLTEEVWLYLGYAYKFVLKDSAGVEIWTHDNIIVYQQTNPLTALADAATITNGDALVAFKQSNSGGVLTGAAASTVHAKLQESVSVKDFGAVGDGTTDDAAAIALAIKSNRRIHFPAGTYLVKSATRVTGLDNISLVGDGIGVSTIKVDSASTFADNPFTFDDCQRLEIRNLTFNFNTTPSLRTGEIPGVYLYACGLWRIDSCEFVGHEYIAVYGHAGSQWWVTNNVFSASNPSSTRHNWNLSVGALTTYGTVANNQFYYSPVLLTGKWITIDGNIFAFSRYGGGLVTGDSPINSGNCGSHTISNNLCLSNTGFDLDNTDVCGMELDGWFNAVTGNYCTGNGGVGIAMIGKKMSVVGNICLGNGTNVTNTQAITDRVGKPDQYVEANPGGMPYHNRAGIKSYQGSIEGVPYGCSYSTVVSNLCADIGANSQYYGYAEETTGLIDMTVAGNSFTSNYGAPTLIKSVQGAYQLFDWTAWTPTVTTSGGTLTATTQGYYKPDGRDVRFEISLYMDSASLSSGDKIYISLPTALGGASSDGVAYGINQSTRKALTVYQYNTSNRLEVSLYDATAAGATGNTLKIAGTYRVL